ncbi:hypothetical protein [Sinorhizobium mexicanum]|uniref:Uncharacterized protein n=1 Tax=Sinorhizobium mexicanum TaxID=375549 RepID=A0A859QK50_9HYPH|nr:hypothetical protein [Sinorhizobium mexicanum]MBP1881983.1 hypothetical protein [Sinorhizobium mexicanum]QLL61717.1 hypothetical protein FKV68_09790 [Sinorhizobium mexicanum]
MRMSSVLRLLQTVCLAAGASFMSAPLVSANDPLPPELEKLKSALEKYKDPVAAVHDGYFSTLGCVTYSSGTMGVHFLNPALIGPEPDPMKPTLLVYEPSGDKLELVAVEWLIPLATGVKPNPELFGHPFDGPMEGHEPLLPAQLHHYDLHAWIFKPNPLGLFHPVNPDVKCPEGPYTLLEEMPKMLPHPASSK